MDLDEDRYISKQLKALEVEKGNLKEQLSNGDISESEYQAGVAKNDYLVAQIMEQNQQDIDRENDVVYERKLSFFSD